MTSGMRVQVEDLRTAGTDLVALSDAVQHHAAAFSGGQDAVFGAASEFDLVQAGGECEQAWQHAVSVTAAGLALDGDTLSMNAESYATTEAATTANLRRQAW